MPLEFVYNTSQCLRKFKFKFPYGRDNFDFYFVV